MKTKLKTWESTKTIGVAKATPQLKEKMKLTKTKEYIQEMNDALVAVINYLDTPSFFNKEQIRSKVNIILNHKDALKEEVELEIKKVEGVK